MEFLKKTAILTCFVALLGFVACDEDPKPGMNGFYYYVYYDGTGNVLESAYCDVTNADSAKVVFGSDSEADFASYPLSVDFNSPDEPLGTMWAFEPAVGDLVPYTDSIGAYMRCEASNDVGDSKETYYFPL